MHRNSVLNLGGFSIDASVDLLSIDTNAKIETYSEENLKSLAYEEGDPIPSIKLKVKEVSCFNCNTIARLDFYLIGLNGLSSSRHSKEGMASPQLNLEIEKERGETKFYTSVVSKPGFSAKNNDQPQKSAQVGKVSIFPEKYLQK